MGWIMEGVELTGHWEVYDGMDNGRYKMNQVSRGG